MHVLMLPSNYANPYAPYKNPFYRDHARLSAERGHATRVLALVGISLRHAVRSRRWYFGLHRQIDAGMRTWVYPYPAPPRSACLNQWLRYRITTHLIRRYQATLGCPDIIHAHGIPAAQCAFWWHRATRAPFVVTMHSTELYDTGASEQVQQAGRALEYAAERLAFSPGYADDLNHLSGLLFDSLPNPVDTEFFRPALAGRSPERPFVFTTVADLRARKNHALLLDAFAARFGGDAGYSLVIAGSGPQLPRLVKRAAALGITSQVCFRGQLNREGVRTLLQESDAFVLASRAETFGVVLVEALACGLPVVATRSHGPEAIIHHQGLGLLSDHNATDLGAAMAAVTTTRYDPDALRAEAVARYHITPVAEQLEQRYHRILAEARDAR